MYPSMYIHKKTQIKNNKKQKLIEKMCIWVHGKLNGLL